MKRALLSTCLSLLFLLGLIREQSLSQSLFINEFMAANSTTIADPDYHAYADFFELYNAADTAVNLKGYSVTDLLSQPRKYIFTTDIVVPARSFVIIWADDKNVGTHANFKLSASGEAIGLFDPYSNVVDTVSFGAQQDDISYGRYPDGTSQWFRFSPASPGTPNLESQIFDRLAPPLLSFQSGFYTAPLTVAITHAVSGVALRYTIDGHTPTTACPLYSAPIRMDSTTVLRVRAFKTGSLSSAIVAATYFLNEPTILPVFSLVTDPENFFSDTSGIYVIGTNGIIAHCSTAPRNWNQDWERPVELELFEPNRVSAFKSPAGTQIFGGCARLYPEKSLAFYFRDEYGAGKLHYRLFPQLCITEYNNFILRSSGQDWWRTMFRDGMVQTLVEQGMKVDHQAYRPSILFINGQYWGIHNIREKLNEHYVESHYPVNKDSIDFLEISQHGTALTGDNIAYGAMIQFLSAHDMSLQASYDSIKAIVDIDEYIDYTIAEIYAANGDWPGSNMKFWRERTPSAKWRWMLSDLDFCFGGNGQGQYNTNTLAQATATNGPSWPNPPWSTLMLRRLLLNAEFKNEFIQRFAVHLNTTFDKDHIVAVIDSLAQGIAAEIPRHKLRWPQSLSIGTTWPENVQIMRNFAALRPAAAIGHFVAQFGLAGTYTLVISRNHPSWGKVYTHGVEVSKNVSSNVFFQQVPLKVRAVSMPGYRFVQWQGASNSTEHDITLTLNSNANLIAVFEPAPLSVTAPVINEINYKSAPLFDTEDWVEFYNPSPDSVDLTGWQFHGESADIFVFAPKSAIAGRDYLVLCRDTAQFKSLRPEVKHVIGNLGFGLSSAGEHVQLTDAGASVVDEVTYFPSAPWVTAPNGTGATLSLIDPQKDNALPEHWRASLSYGTPGRINDVYTKADENDPSLPERYVLFNSYPNPFNPATTIRYGLPNRSVVTLSIYNVLGQTAAQLVNGIQEAGFHEVRFDAGSLTSGVYFYRIVAGDPSTGSGQSFVQTKKLLLLR